MAAGLRTLMENPAHRHIAVLGAMGELGPHAVSAHQQIGQLCASLRIDILLTVGSGNHAHEITEAALRAGLHSARHFADHATCAAHLQSLATADDLILIKGSRSSGMEQIITLLA
jgi:UDP-N-acetylmuramoyl-tripeptide--D-alanyl-D-alanine ligase